jgi:heat shock protein HtpX
MNHPTAMTTISRFRSLATSAVFLVGIATLAAAVGYILFGGLGALAAVALAAASGYAGAQYADRYILRAVRARPIDPFEAPGLHSILGQLTQTAGLPMPRLYVFPSSQPNAFTVGRDPSSASIALSTTLVQRLEERSLTGVLAHEVAHIRHRDILLASFAATVTQMLRDLGRAMALLGVVAFPVLLITAPKLLVVWFALGLTPLVALLLQNALARQREFAADAEAARLTGDPMGLAVALRSIEQSQRSLLMRLFGFAPRGGTPLHSHPATDARIARLHRMKRTQTPHMGGRVEPIRPLKPRVGRPIRVIPGHREIPGYRARRSSAHARKFVG